MTATTSIGAPQQALGLGRPRPRDWARLAGMHARSFAREPSTRALLPLPGLAAVVLWLVVLGLLAAGLGVSVPGGGAFALLVPSRLGLIQLARAAAVAAAGVVGMIVLALALALAMASGPLAQPPWGFVVVAALVAAGAPAGLSCLRGQATRARLRAARPTGPHWFVSGVCRAADSPGAGAELMSGMCRAADEQGLTLALDAIAPGLVGYYARFGFAASAPAERLPGGALVTPMARAAREPRS